MKIKLKEGEKKKLKCPECGTVDPMVEISDYASDCFEDPDYEGRLSKFTLDARYFRCEYCGYHFEVTLVPGKTNKTTNQPTEALQPGRRGDTYIGHRSRM